MAGEALRVIIDLHFWAKALMFKSFSLTYATCSRAWCPLAVFPFEHQFMGDRLVLRDCVFEFNSWIFGLEQELRKKRDKYYKQTAPFAAKTSSETSLSKI